MRNFTAIKTKRGCTRWEESEERGGKKCARRRRAESVRNKRRIKRIRGTACINLLGETGALHVPGKREWTRGLNEFRINPTWTLRPISHRNALADTAKWSQRINVWRMRNRGSQTREINLLMNKPETREFRIIVIIFLGRTGEWKFRARVFTINNGQCVSSGGPRAD